jgi:hypothetical protein
MLIRKAILIDLIQQQLKLQGGFTKSTEVRHAKVTKLLIQSKNLRELLVLDSIKYYIWQTGIKKTPNKRPQTRNNSFKDPTLDHKGCSI